MMAASTSNIQRREAEARLNDILKALGQKRIPELDVADFKEDLLKHSPSSREWKSDILEEHIGVRLLLRILEQDFVTAFTRLSIANSSLDKTSLEKEGIEQKIKYLQKEIKKLQVKELSTANVIEKLRTDNEKLRTDNEKLKTENKTLYSGLANKKANDVDDTSNSEELNLRKRKKSPLFQLDGTPDIKRSGNRMFRNKDNPNKAVLLHSTQAHLDDASFVPETMEIASEIASPGCRKSTKFGGNTSVPETPEKELRPSGNIEECVTPDHPKSPLILRPSISSVSQKRKLFPRKTPDEPLKEKKTKTAKIDLLKISKNKKTKTSTTATDDKNILKEMAEVNVVCSKKVGKIDPGAQSEIDKKSFRLFEDDFPKKNTSKRSQQLRNLPSDTDSDFESPNLLKKQTLRLKENLKETLPRKDSAGCKEDIKKKNIFEDDYEDDIDVFNSPTEEEEVKLKPKKKLSVRSVRSENRWGIEHVRELSDSNKKSLSKKQIKIDGFFKNPPKTPMKTDDTFVRVNQADTNMEKAIELSLKTTEVSKDLNNDKKKKVTETETEGEAQGNSGPNFAYVGPAVRKKEERKKLRGFDCGECREYYQQKLEEGFSKDQILKLMNNCSKHRGNFKPPLTPEKFWEVDIVEDDEDDPRSRAQPGPPLKSRSQRRAAAKLKRKL